MQKLVRDKIPEIINQKWEKCEFIISSGNQYSKALKEKVVEEAKEILDSKNDKELQEEIADLYEVLEALIKNENFDKSKILEIMKQKKEEKWAFDKWIILTKY